ncbi:hypothetical protein AMTR_s04713p00001610, partial [Amborella trichopoda]
GASVHVALPLSPKVNPDAPPLEIDREVFAIDFLQLQMSHIKKQPFWKPVEEKRVVGWSLFLLFLAKKGVLLELASESGS